MRDSGPIPIVTANHVILLAAHARHKEIQLVAPVTLVTTLNGWVLLANMIAMTESMVILRRTCAFCAIILASLAREPVPINAQCAPKVSSEENLCASLNARKVSS